MIGLSYSFFFYAFLYLLRTTFRLLSLTRDYDIWILNPDEVNFYNLFYAYISVILAASVCFSFWFEKPRKIFQTRNRKRAYQIRSLTAFNWFFLSWFSKLALIYSVIFGMAFHRGFYTFSLYPNYNYVFILIIITLLLLLTSTIREFFRNWAFSKSMLLIFIISSISYGLSKVNFINHEKFNQNYLSKSIRYNYKLELPESEFTERLFKLNLFKDLYIVKSKKEKNTQPILILDHKELSISELSATLKDKLSMFGPMEQSLLTVQLHIDKSIKMEFVNQIKKIITELDITRIAFAVIPTNRELDANYYRNYSFKQRIQSTSTSFFDPYELYEMSLRYENQIILRLNKKYGFSLNGVPISIENYKLKLNKLVVENSDYLIHFLVDDNITIEKYLGVRSATWKVLMEIRNDCAIKEYNQEYEFLDYGNQRIIKKKYPIRLYEPPKELKIFYDNQ